MNLRQRILAGVASAAIAAMAPVTAIAETLGDALVSAYNNSGLLDQNRALLRAADEDVAIAFAAVRPIIGWSATAQRSYSRFSSTATGGVTASSNATTATIGLSIEQLLYDNGATNLAIAAAKETVLATRQSLISVEQQVLLNAVQAFMNVRRDNEILTLRQNNLRLLNRELRAAKDRFEVGEVTRTDVSLAEAALAGARASLAVAHGNLMASREVYAVAIGHKPGNLRAPSRLPATAKTADAAKAVAVSRHPDMIKTQHDVATAELSVQRARAQMGATVKFNGSLSKTETQGSSDFSDGANFSVSLSQPIYYGGQLSALLRKTMAQRDATRAGLHLTRIGLERQAGTAWATLSATRAQRVASEGQIRAARLAFEGVREEATLGSRTTLDVLNSEQVLLDAESDRITARSNEFIAAYSLLASMGLLTADHLNLKIEQYDPAAYYNQVKDAPALVSKRGKQLDKVLRKLGKD
jgi:outer membrane protein